VLTVIGEEALLSLLLRHNHICFFVHDIDYLRQKKDYAAGETVKFLNQAQTLICHNPKMIQKLQEDGVTRPRYISLQLFDYLVPGGVTVRHDFGCSVVFAGNLAKSGFIYQLAQQNLHFSLHLYGVPCPSFENQNIVYEGSCPSDELVNHLNYSYGLVWDGDGIETCSGEIGEYTKYNNPHKLSLYMTAGMPVIVWSQAAIADFILENKVGFVVDSLLEISQKIESVTKEQYEAYLKNAAKIQKRVLNGEYTKEAYQAVLDNEVRNDTSR